jgi:hypothetical protein
MLRLVALVRTDVPEEFSTSIIRATRVCELGTTLAVVCVGCWLRLTLFLVHRFLSP